MQVAKLPDTVLKVLGTEAAEDFVHWLEVQFGHTGLSPDIQISSFVARQKVNVLMLERVSNLLLAGEPSLVKDTHENWVWRVPVDLTYPSCGRVGCIGEVDVDARYGETRYDQALLKKIINKTRQLAREVLHPAS
jgi:hypothetical protein